MSGMKCQLNSSTDTLRVSKIYQNCRYPKKTQISLDPKKYRYVGDIASFRNVKMTPAKHL
jgi:hypothetical protein